MANGDGFDTLRVKIGPVTVGAGGTVAIFILLFCALIAANLWAGWLLQQEIRMQTASQTGIIVQAMQDRSTEHAKIEGEQRRLAGAMDRTACLLSLNEQERHQLRQLEQPFSRWCWWLKDGGSW